jgi:urea carboxylase
MFRKLLIANRGKTVVRIISTARRLGLPTVAVYSDADRFTMPVRLADEAVRIGKSPVAESYLDGSAIIAARRAIGADALHPGYGFLSENADFAARLGGEGIAFVGPAPEHIRLFGLKHTARQAAAGCGIKLLPGSDLLDGLDAALTAAAAIGYPVMLKSTTGGGGIGMQLCREPGELISCFDTAAARRKVSAMRGSIWNVS